MHPSFSACLALLFHPPDLRTISAGRVDPELLQRYKQHVDAIAGQLGEVPTLSVSGARAVQPPTRIPLPPHLVRGPQNQRTPDNKQQPQPSPPTSSEAAPSQQPIRLTDTARQKLDTQGHLQVKGQPLISHAHDRNSSCYFRSLAFFDVLFFC